MARRPRSVTAAVVTLAVLATSGALSACAGGSAAGTGPSAASLSAPASTGTPATPTASPRPELIAITSADVPMPPAQSSAPATDAPVRIVSLATGVGETLAALGVADRVVGRDETSDVPAIDAAPVVTKAHATNAERVLATDPDVVLVDAATSPPEALDQIRSAGVRVVEVPEAWTLADIEARTHAVADAVGVDRATADAVVAEATTRSPSSPTDRRPRVAFLYLRGTSAIYLVGGKGSGADAVIDAAGGIDAGAEAGLDAYVPLTAEAVAALDPDVILVMTKGLKSVGGVDGLVGLPGVAQTTAGQERRVVAVDDTLLLSFGPRTGELVARLGQALQEISG